MDINSKVQSYKSEIIHSTIELININSTEREGINGMPFGQKVAEALDKALEISRDLGFSVKNLNGYVGYAEYGEGEEYVAVLGHLDIVPSGDSWTVDPFAGEIKDGKLFGRGAIDDKGPIIASLYALKAIKELGLKLSKKVRIIFGTNEESGSKDIEYYLEHEKAPVFGFTPDADFPVINGEKGIMVFDIVKKIDVKKSGLFKIEEIKGGNKANMVPDYCEARLKSENLEELIYLIEEYGERRHIDIKGEKFEDHVIVKTKGISAHGSTPEEGLNAIMLLIGFLSTLDLPNDSLRDAINFLDEYIGVETDGDSLGIGISDEFSGSLTLNVGIIDFQDMNLKVTLNTRYPVTKTLEDVMIPLEEKLKGEGFKIENIMEEKPLFFEENHILIKTLKEVYESVTKEDGSPISIGGGTYAKTMPNTVAFGALFKGREDVAHKADEYIYIEDLIKCAKIYAEAIYRLAK